MDNSNLSYKGRHILVGAIIVAIGLLWLLDELRILPYWLDDYIFSWQMIIIAIGIVALTNRRNKLPGLILVVIGVLFLIPEFFWFRWDVIWPLVVIVIGVAIMFRTRQRHSQDNFDVADNDPDFFEVTSVFGGGEKIITSQNLKGGNATAVFGGSEINLLNAQLTDQHDVLIDFFAVFGGTTLIVPPDWEIVNDIQTIFGGFSDKRNVGSRTNPSKRIYLKGTVIFGGGEIKSYK